MAPLGALVGWIVRYSNAQLEAGTAVTVPRTLVDVVVTEHGIASLQRLTERERASALADLAHPTFRDGLRSEARRLSWP